MNLKSTVFAFILVFTQLAFSGECLITNALNNPKLNENAEFWTEYSLWIEKGIPSDDAIKALSKKYDSSEHTKQSKQTDGPPKPSLRLVMKKRAENEIARLPAQLKKKVDEFLDVSLKPAGVKDLYDNPGRWHFEKLAQFGPEAHSVRINGGYRILFDLKDGNLVLREVNKDHIHSK